MKLFYLTNQAGTFEKTFLDFYSALCIIWKSMSVSTVLQVEFPIRLRLLNVRLSIIFEKMFEYFD